MNHRRNISIASLLIFCALLIGCSTLYTGIVSMTSVVDSGMKQWAALSIAGKTTPEIDAKVIKAHDTYRAACGVAQRSLIVYKQGGSQEAYLTALQAAKVAASGLFDIITPLLTPDNGATLKSQLAKANAP